MPKQKISDLAEVKERLGKETAPRGSFEGDEYSTAIAKTIKEDEELIKAGFEYVTEREGVKIYRKRK